jgi:hypothetical protein
MEEFKDNKMNGQGTYTFANGNKYVGQFKDEKYDGFDLYIRIAHDVHNAVPREQLHRPIFQQFLWKNT